MSESMKCSKRGGWFLEDDEKCICDEQEIKKLKKEIKDLNRIWYAIYIWMM